MVPWSWFPKNNSPEISLNMIQLQYFGKKESEIIVTKTTPQSPKYDSPKAITYFCFFLTVLLEKITLIYKAVGRCWLFAGSWWLFTLSMIPFHEWQEDLTVSCFLLSPRTMDLFDWVHLESLQELVWDKELKNRFASKMVFSCVVWFVHLRCAWEHFWNKHFTCVNGTASFYALNSNRDLEDMLKFHPPKKTSTYSYHLNFHVKYLCFFIPIPKKAIKYQKHPSIPTILQDFCPPLHIFSANPFDLGLFRICHVNLKEGIFRPRVISQMRLMVSLPLNRWLVLFTNLTSLSFWDFDMFTSHEFCCLYFSRFEKPSLFEAWNLKPSHVEAHRAVNTSFLPLVTKTWVAQDIWQSLGKSSSRWN